MQRHRTSTLTAIAAIATLGALVGAALIVRPARATPSTGVGTTILAQSLFDEIRAKARTPLPERWKAQLKTHGQSDVYVVDNKFAPGGTSGWHSHPGPSLILVVAGTVTNHSGDDPSCTPQVYTAGDGFIDPGSGDVHMLRNETSAPAETIAVQLLPKAAVESCCSTDRRRGSQRLPLLGSGRMPEGGPVPTLRRSPPRKEKARLDVTLAGTSGSARRLVLEPRLRSCALRCRMRRGLAMAA